MHYSRSIIAVSFVSQDLFVRPVGTASEALVHFNTVRVCEQPSL